MYFFIPIGHENSKIRRFPAACFGIILICLMAFGWSWPRHEQEAGELERAFNAVLGDYVRLAAGGSDDYSEYQERVRAAHQLRNPQEFLAAVDAAIEEHRNDADPDDLERLENSVREVRQLLEGGVFHAYGLLASAPSPLTFFTHMFLHGGIAHLIGNLLFLCLVGPTLEDLWGRTVFVTSYLLSGLVAAAGYLLVTGPEPIPMIGASGAIAGLMGSFLVAFTHTRIDVVGFLFIFFRIRFYHFSIPAWVFLPIWIGMEILQGLAQFSAGGSAAGGVAHWAHISGFFFGLAVPSLLKVSGLERRLFPAVVKGRRGKEVRVSVQDEEYLHDPAYREASRYRDQPDLIRAETGFQDVCIRFPNAVGPRLDLIDVLLQMHEKDKLRPALLQSLELACKVKDARILDVYEILRREFPMERIPAEASFRVGLAFERAGKHFDAFECLQRFCKSETQHPLWIRGAVRLADLMTGPINNPAAARELLLKARDAAVEPNWKDEVEKRLQALERSASGAPPATAAASAPAPGSVAGPGAVPAAVPASARPALSPSLRISASSSSAAIRKTQADQAKV